MKAIDTRYAGRRFRSRLEARWAVFFDALGIRWDYEPEGVQTPHGPYLPDFLLHLAGKRTLFEIKPQHQAGQVDPRWAGAAQFFGCRMVVAYGMPRPDAEDIVRDDVADGPLQLVADGPGLPVWDNFHAFCTCRCGEVGVEFDGRGARVCGDRCDADDKSYSYDDPRIRAAYAKAHSARFEHGETGR